MAKRSYNLASTTTVQSVANYDNRTLFNHICIQNLTDGDVEFYFGDANDDTNIIAAKTVLLVLDKFPFSGQAYYHNITGTGGQVVLSVWQDEEK